MENYICINGKKAELTKEQIKALGIELPSKTLFSMESDELYCFISSYGNVIETTTNVNRDVRYNVANYCTDKAIMKQRALYETLNRLLWRYSMEHNGDKIDWKNTCCTKWYVYYHAVQNVWKIDCVFHTHDLAISFYDEETAKNAIEEIINPFMEAHPEFKW